MKLFLTYIILFSISVSFSQENDKAIKKQIQKANNLVFKANDLVSENDVVSAEMEYRKALSEQPNNVAGAYNLGHSYYKEGNYDEALFRTQQTAKNAKTKTEKHKAFHNIGNILMQNKKYKEAVEAYKSALRNNPKDEETRYNLALAKELAKQQEEQDKKDDKNDKDKDKKDDKKDGDDKKDDKKDKGDDKKDDKNDKGDQDKKDGDDKKDEDKKPEDDKKEDGKNKDQGDKKKDEPKKPQQQPGKLSPQQIKSLLEAMNNQEQKVQDKINAKKAKGVKVQTDKDW